MKGGLRLFGLTVLLCLVLAGSAMASGFAIYEWSARGNAMGGAVVATPKDASTAAHNPAGAVELEGHNFYAGLSAITPSASLTMKNYGDEDAKTNTFLPPHAYYVGRLNENMWFTGGVFTRFGLGTEWDERWAGRYNVTEAEIQSLSFNPNLVCKISDTLAVGVGVEVMWFEFMQRKSVDRSLGHPLTGETRNDPNTYGYDSDAKLLGDSIGKGFTLSMYHKPLDWLRVGAVYRSAVRQKIAGNVWFRHQGTQKHPLLPDSFEKNMSARGVITLPDSYTVGVSVDATDDLTIEGDVVWTRWSTYQQLRIDYDEPLVPGTASTDHSTTVKNWRDTFRYQLGAEYDLNDLIDLRCSYIYDQSPIRDDRDDYMLPTNDRQLYSAGVGFNWDNYLVDVAYTFLVSKSRTYTFRGDAEGIRTGEANNQDTHILGLSLGYKF